MPDRTQTLSVELGRVTVECPRCEGGGQVPDPTASDGWLECDLCGGSGLISLSKRIELALLEIEAKANAAWTRFEEGRFVERNEEAVDCYRRAVRIIRAALSQPEYQGDEEAERIVARIVSHWLINRGAEIRAGQPLTGTPNGIAQEILAALPSQPPAPALSDKERERMEKVIYDFKAFAVGSPRLEAHVAFLRNLASREQGGEDAYAKHQTL